MLDIQPEFLTIIKSLLNEFVPNMTVWAYGSRVKGKSHEGSDLDLVILNPNDETLPQKNLSALREALAESDPPILVDVQDWSTLSIESKNEIQKNHVIISH
jgi:predicted nucleotidyltransferase